MNIPTFQEAYTLVEAKNFTALDRFVFDNEPDGEEDEREFRDGLQAVVDELIASERERVLAAINTDLSWCKKDGASYENCIDFAKLQKIVLNPQA